MRTLRSRLIFSHILPLAIVAPLVAISLIYLLETQFLLSQYSQRLSQQANLMAQALATNPAIFSDPRRAEAFVSEMRIYSDGPIVLMRPDGALIALSDQGAQPLDWEGIDQALSGRTSVIVTYGWAGRGQVLVPVVNAQQQLVGIVGMSETLAGVTSQFGRLRLLVLAILVVGVVVGSVVGLILAVWLERPIGRAANAAVGIAHGQAVQPLPVSGPVEIRGLSESINLLAARLSSLEDSRRRSLANIVHELGRPLGAIRSAVHVLRQDAGEDAAIRAELLEGIEMEIERMTPLLDELSQLHGQVEGNVHLDRRPTDMNAWLPPVLAPWRAAAIDKGLQWEAQIAPDLPTLDVDPGRLAQALSNLLSNAVKYTVAGQVSVQATADGGRLLIAIADTGLGIAAEDMDHVFDPFYRSPQVTRYPYGLGLGLTIAHDLVRAHGGDIELESKVGEGSRFTVRLPAGSGQQVTSEQRP